MPIRIETKADGQIEVMRVHEGCTSFLHFDDETRALAVIKFFLKLEQQAAAAGRFVPQLQRDARKAFKQLEDKSPYGNGKE